MKVDLSKIIEEAIREFNNENKLAIAEIGSVRTFKIDHEKEKYYKIFIKPRIEFLKEKEIVFVYLTYPDKLIVIWEELEEVPYLIPFNLKTIRHEFNLNYKEKAKLELKEIFNRVVEIKKYKFELKNEELELINKIKRIIGDFPLYTIRRDFDKGLDIKIKIIDYTITLESNFTFKDYFKPCIREIWVSLTEDANTSNKKEAIINYLRSHGIKVLSYLTYLSVDTTKLDVDECLDVLRKILEAIISLYLF